MTDTEGSDLRRLARAAHRLGRRAAVASPLPSLWFFTDPERTPEPERIAARLPAGSGVVFRHFGAADAEAQVERLAAIARKRRLILLIGDDPALAATVSAAGVHLPQRQMGAVRTLREARSDWIVTAAAHDWAAVRMAAHAGVDAVFVSPVFKSDSPSAGAPLGLSRMRRWVARTRAPVFALGGVNAQTIGRLRGTGVAGFAAVAALAD